jgi:ubiquitin-protein ligase
MSDTPAGMTIHFDEGNMTEWEIVLDGPEQSVYAVRLSTFLECPPPLLLTELSAGRTF